MKTCTICGLNLTGFAATAAREGFVLAFCPRCGARLAGQLAPSVPPYTADEGRQALEGRLAQLRRNLDRLEEQKARHGMDVPLNILNEISEAKAEMRLLKERLREVPH